MAAAGIGLGAPEEAKKKKKKKECSRGEHTKESVDGEMQEQLHCTSRVLDPDRVELRVASRGTLKSNV